jgi:superfamily II DNA/RNA helicase
MPRSAAQRGNARPVRHSDLDRRLTAALAEPAPAHATFAALGLPGPLASALARGGIQQPFAIQARALPDALAGRDVLGRAQTGSGKTLAFGLAMLARLAGPLGGTRRRQPKAPRGLVLVPTRELARQVAEVLTPLGHSVGVSVATVYGGVPLGRQADRLQRGVDIVVATPGRLIDLLERRACTLDRIEITVLDEADHMADLGFLPAVTRILDATPAGGQRLLFSATLDRDVDRLVNSYLTAPALHAVAPASEPGQAADHQAFELAAEDKVAVAAELASHPARTLFFTRTKHGAARLAKQLTRSGQAAAAIHGNLTQNQRQRALDGFAAGRPRVLVATDVAARGLHIDDVGLVVHFDPPNDPKDYLHRSGRTARAGASGTVVSFVTPAQARDMARLHQAAGVTASKHRVRPGHPTVRELVRSGNPISSSSPALPSAQAPSSIQAPSSTPMPSAADAPRSRPAAPPRPNRPARSSRPGRSGRAATSRHAPAPAGDGTRGAPRGTSGARLSRRSRRSRPGLRKAS